MPKKAIQDRMATRNKKKRQSAVDRTARGDDADQALADAPEERKGGFWHALRDNADALIFAILIAMFIRVFVCELFKIPSPSMTPTLLGTEPGRQSISYFDVDKDGKKDMILKSDYTMHVFRKEDGYYRFAGSFSMGSGETAAWLNDAHVHQDRILVAKFLYWFTPPDRGDIVVFRVPKAIFEPSKPVYIKRVVGLPGETLSFRQAQGVPGHPQTMGRLLADGELVTEPPFFAHQSYEFRAIQGIRPDHIPDYYDYKVTPFGYDIKDMHVPQDSVIVMGDNTVSSQDSRYWGAVPLGRLRGRAIFRFWFRFPHRWGIVPTGVDAKVNFLE